MDARAIEKLLYKQSGLLGVSGISSDMRKLLDSRRSAREAGGRSLRLPHRPRARLARGGARRARRARLHRRHRRERARRSASASAATRPGSASSSTTPPTPRGGPRISAPAQPASAWVIPTNEELMIARHTRACSRRADGHGSSAHNPVLAGKKALVVGIANDHSIAYGCANAFRDARRRARDHLPQRQGQAVRRAARQGARRADLPAARRPAPGRARGGVRGDPEAVGPARHPGALDRVRAEGGPAGRAARLLGRGLRRSRWTSPATRSCAWRSSPRR